VPSYCPNKFAKPDDWIFAGPFKAGTMPWLYDEYLEELRREGLFNS
jgi:hypothetical protein